jgi:hypothetical protein
MTVTANNPMGRELQGSDTRQSCRDGIAESARPVPDAAPRGRPACVLRPPGARGRWHPRLHKFALRVEYCPRLLNRYNVILLDAAKRIPCRNRHWPGALPMASTLEDHSPWFIRSFSHLRQRVCSVRSMAICKGHGRLDRSKEFGRWWPCEGDGWFSTPVHKSSRPFETPRNGFQRGAGGSLAPPLKVSRGSLVLAAT